MSSFHIFSYAIFYRTLSSGSNTIFMSVPTYPHWYHRKSTSPCNFRSSPGFRVGTLFSVVTGSFDVSYLLSKVIKCADDFIICTPIYRNSEISHVHAIHNTVVCWFKRVELNLNIEKCKMTSFNRKGISSSVDLVNLPFVNELRILGVTFTSNGSWSPHIAQIVRNASQRLFLLRLVKSYTMTCDLKNLFNGFLC